MTDSNEDRENPRSEYPKVGTKEWWLNGFIYGSHGIIHAIVNLAADSNITPKKAVELIEALLARREEGIPPAPWEDVRWGSE